MLMPIQKNVLITLNKCLLIVIVKAIMVRTFFEKLAHCLKASVMHIRTNKVIYNDPPYCLCEALSVSLVTGYVCTDTTALHSSLLHMWGNCCGNLDMDCQSPTHSTP